MTKKQAPKKAAKPPKAKETKGNAPDRPGMGTTFDAAMSRIANAPWPLKKKR